MGCETRKWSEVRLGDMYVLRVEGYDVVYLVVGVMDVGRGYVTVRVMLADGECDEWTGFGRDPWIDGDPVAWV